MNNDTPCKDCTFAEYEGITQTGCKRGMIDKYRELGTEIIEAYDDEKEFFVIKDRYCPYFRNAQWLSRFKEDEGRDEAIEKVLDFETTLSFHCIVFINNSDLDAIEKTIRSLGAQEITPSQVTVVRSKRNKIQPKKLATLLGDSLSSKWRIENLVIDLSHSQIIHMVQKTVKSQFYMIAHAGYEFPPNYLQKINNAVRNDLLQFAMIENEDNNSGIVIPLPVHEYWHFQGNVEKTIPENIREFQCQNPANQIIFQIQNL